MRIFQEIITDYTDDEGVLHVDAYKTGENEEGGRTIAYITKTHTIISDVDGRVCEYAQEMIAEAEKEVRDSRLEENEDIDKLISAIKNDIEEYDDLTCLEELLQFLPDHLIKNALPEDLAPKKD